MPSLRVLGHAFRAWRRNRTWAKHEPETPYLADLLSGDPVCLHVGASDGRHSYVMTQVAPKARIYAFEPSAFAFEVLQTTIAWHRLGKQVIAVHAAVADKSGDLLLVTPKKTSGRMGRAYAYVAETRPTAPRGPTWKTPAWTSSPRRSSPSTGFAKPITSTRSTSSEWTSKAPS